MAEALFSASAPASSANLGPGFDSIAVALSLRCEVQVRPSDAWSIHHQGDEPFSADPEDDAVLTAARTVTTTPLEIEVESTIPLSRGLGSSAAAFSAGALAALRAIGQEPDHDALFDVVRDLEGHPDNAAAAVYGGLVAVADDTVIHLTWHDDLVPVVAVPGTTLRTTEARRALLDAYPLPVVTRTLGRYTALVEGLRTGNPAVLAKASGDELHEAPRASLDPQVAAVMEVARQAGALHTCWSGAGPSVLCVVPGDLVTTVVDELTGFLGRGGRVLTLTPDRDGAH